MLYTSSRWVLFQSTLPVRGVTVNQLKDDLDNVISIHTPREGSDFLRLVSITQNRQFQSTLPVRGVTSAL